MNNNREILIENIKKMNDLAKLKAYLFDVTSIAAANHPKQFRKGKYLKQMKKIYGILESIEKIE